MTPEREVELLSLIRDLNECNDVLLEKVSQLEDALDHSQTALQAEIDRAQLAGAPQSAVPTSDRHIAQLVTELDLGNQALKQQQMLNQTLQAELTAAQERANQLEQECALLQQKYTDQAQSLVQAENSCADLRARLQRQQRYTLQFKAALEKCLNVSQNSHPAASFVNAAEVQSASASVVSMPKAQSIRPWIEESPAYDRIDPQLESLVRGIRSPSMPSQPSPPPRQTDPVAEVQLWHDLARVIDDSAADVTEVTQATPSEATSTESVQFTEPSPWGVPISEARPPATPPKSEVSVEVLAAAAPSATTDAYVPAMTFQDGLPSPLVYPLRTPKRIPSLAAVELPTFPRPQKKSGY